MSTKIYVVKYIRDPRRWEPRNVGVLITNADDKAAKFLGDQPDGTTHKTAVKGFVNDRDTYVDWVRYFKDTLTPGEEGISAIRAETDGNYWVAEAGDVWQGEGRPSEIIDRYFAELVRAEPARESEADENLEHTVSRLLREAGVLRNEHFQLGGEVPSTIEVEDGSPVPYRFPYYWSNGSELVGDRLSAKNIELARAKLWKMQNIAPDIGRVAFVQSSGDDDDYSYLVAELDNVLSHVSRKERIDVSDEQDALRRIQEVFGD